MCMPIIGDQGNVLVGLFSDTRFVAVKEWWQAPPRFYKFPGGGIEPGETIFEAGSRELWEETGIDYPARKLRFLCKVESISKWSPNSIFTRYFIGSEVKESGRDAHTVIGPLEGEFVYTPPLSLLKEPDFYYEHHKILLRAVF
jgi:8-oxo-dGTP pyrophosphatase MutT (NUDIX family)